MEQACGCAKVQGGATDCWAIQEHVYNITVPATCLPHTGFAGVWTPATHAEFSNGTGPYMVRGCVCVRVCVMCRHVSAPCVYVMCRVCVSVMCLCHVSVSCVCIMCLCHVSVSCVCAMRLCRVCVTHGSNSTHRGFPPLCCTCVCMCMCCAVVMLC